MSEVKLEEVLEEINAQNEVSEEDENEMEAESKISFDAKSFIAGALADRALVAGIKAYKKVKAETSAEKKEEREKKKEQKKADKEAKKAAKSNRRFSPKLTLWVETENAETTETEVKNDSKKGAAE